MILRKKNSHVSFLHLYHHAGMVPISWGCTKYLPGTTRFSKLYTHVLWTNATRFYDVAGGHGTFVGFVNTFVHTIMYSYYLLAILRPPNKYGQIWWKKYLTMLQLVRIKMIYRFVNQSLYFERRLFSEAHFWALFSHCDARSRNFWFDNQSCNFRWRNTAPNLRHSDVHLVKKPGEYVGSCNFFFKLIIPREYSRAFPRFAEGHTTVKFSSQDENTVFLCC